MAAPLSGVGQQQVPLAQPFQPGGSDQTREVRRQEQEPRDNELQVRGAAASQTQETNEQDNGNREDFQLSASLQRSDSNSYSSQDRGSVIDITV